MQPCRYEAKIIRMTKLENNWQQIAHGKKSGKVITGQEQIELLYDDQKGGGITFFTLPHNFFFLWTFGINLSFFFPTKNNSILKNRLDCQTRQNVTIFVYIFLILDVAYFAFTPKDPELDFLPDLDPHLLSFLLVSICKTL